MSERYIIIAEAKAVPGQADRLRELLVGMIEPSRAEAGCVQYTLHEDPLSPGHFFFYEVWKDQAAFEYHTTTPHYVALGPKLEGVKADGPPLRKLRVIA